ncbi:MAG TPA: DUF3160 domain-containing protein [Chitinivibrionales bacterium]|jgi:hypothetical protein|nr:DUF3160 domain-containing protein [Chitinivibrionales bacterium]
MKRNIAILILFACMPCLATLGDVNGDGVITLDDCKAISSAVANGTAAGLSLSVADIDGDGAITILDAMRLHQYIGGLWADSAGKLPQNPQINEAERSYLARYEDLCSQYDNMSPQQFLSGFPALPGYSSQINPASCLYYDTIASAFSLTADQTSALKQQGFVLLKNAPSDVYTGFGNILSNVYRHDLPVFVTADAILDPLYKAYDDILKGIELNKLQPEMSNILQTSLTQLQTMKTAHAGQPTWDTALADAELYLAVARALLDGSSSVTTTNPAVMTAGNAFLAAIASEALSIITVFGEKNRSIDFSQFTPRGHYTCFPQATEQCQIAEYFKCMMWLGRADCAFVIDSLRQLRDFLAVYECMDKAGALPALADFNSVITVFVGDMDEFGTEGLTEFYKTSRPSIDSIMQSDAMAAQLRTSLMLKGCGNQFILSQTMWKDPDAARPNLPSIAQVSGQRFILDSYLLGHSVEWYVQGRNVPKLEEVAFCLGNNAAVPVLASEVTTYTSTQGDYRPLHCRLGGMRTLFENYPYWSHNLYTDWLDALRELSKPLSAAAPTVMRSACWQDKQMNAQLASWAQLRHNTLLYAKQSYTGLAGCFFPTGYVEPYPTFYRKIGTLMTALGAAADAQAGSGYYATWKAVTDTLALIAEQELSGQNISPECLSFLNRMLVANSVGGCGGPPYSGWYPSLFTKGWSDCGQARPCIADVHTVGPSIIKPDNMVLHAATGTTQAMVIVCSTNDSCGTVFVGPVSSFYQYNVTPIARETDDEWVTILQSQAPLQPDWMEKYKK